MLIYIKNQHAAPLLQMCEALMTEVFDEKLVSALVDLRAALGVEMRTPMYFRYLAERELGVTTKEAVGEDDYKPSFVVLKGGSIWADAVRFDPPDVGRYRTIDVNGGIHIHHWFPGDGWVDSKLVVVGWDEL